MLNPVSTILLLLTAVTILSYAAQRLSIPYPTLMVVAGAFLGWIPGLPHIEFESETVLLLFLPPLLYAAAWQTSWRDFKENLRPILMLAVGLVVTTTLAVAWLTHYWIADIPWALAFALGALVAPPDAVAATAVTAQVALPRRVITILEGESLVNDATGLVLYRVAVGAAVTGVFSWTAAGVQFLLAPLGGIALGLTIGWLAVWLHRRLEDPTLECAITLLTPFAAYVPAENIGASGVLAVVSAGMFVSRASSEIFSPATRLQAGAVWGVLVYMLNGLAFTLIGLQIPESLKALARHAAMEVIGLTVLVCLAVIVVRLLWIFPAAYLPRLMSKTLRERDPAPPAGMLAIIGWAGMRGVVTIAAALALPHITIDGEASYFRELLVVVAFAVVLATLVIQGQTLPALIRWLRIAPDRRHEMCTDAIAREELLNATVAFLDSVQAEKKYDPEIVQHLRDRYERLLLTTLPPTQSGRIDPRALALGTLSLEALSIQREKLMELDRQRRVPLEIFRRIERVLDLEEARIAEILPWAPISEGAFSARSH